MCKALQATIEEYLMTKAKSCPTVILYQSMKGLGSWT